MTDVPKAGSRSSRRIVASWATRNWRDLRGFCTFVHLRKDASMNYKMPLVIILLLLVVIFTLQNTEQVNISLLFWHVTLSRALMIFLVLAIGLLAGWILGTVQCRRHPPGHDMEVIAEKNEDDPDEHKKW